MKRPSINFFSGLIVSLCVLSTACRSSVTPDAAGVLQRQTQELLDAIAAGDRGPWTRYLDDRVIFSAEDGSTKSKTQVVDELKPLPKEIWGSLRVTDFRVELHDRTAVTNYVADEEEGIFASQLLALLDDPPAMSLPATTLDDYVGAYSLTPEITYTISRDSDGLVGTRTGRKPEALKVELRDCLFVPGQPRLRKIFQRDTNGRITGFVERRESWDIAWRRLP
jgi:Domain of unknown function (DUF4440)